MGTLALLPENIRTEIQPNYVGETNRHSSDVRNGDDNKTDVTDDGHRHQSPTFSRDPHVIYSEGVFADTITPLTMPMDVSINNAGNTPDPFDAIDHYCRLHY